MKAVCRILCLVSGILICGCVSEPELIETPKDPAACVIQMKAFQDEKYVWENWQHGTNRVDDVQFSK